MCRVPLVSLGAIFVIAMLFLTMFMTRFFLSFLVEERAQIEQSYSYPLVLDNTLEFSDKRVIDFIASLLSSRAIAVQPVLVSREEVLDEEVKNNPSILSLLGGENPFSQSIRIPLEGANIEKLGQEIRAFRDIFSVDTDVQTISNHLESYSKMMRRINQFWLLVLVYSVCTGAMLVGVGAALTRFHFERFVDERHEARRITPRPLLIWGPHILSFIIYATLGYLMAYWVIGYITTMIR